MSKVVAGDGWKHVRYPKISNLHCDPLNHLGLIDTYFESNDIFSDSAFKPGLCYDNFPLSLARSLIETILLNNYQQVYICYVYAGHEATVALKDTICALKPNGSLGDELGFYLHTGMLFRLNSHLIKDNLERYIAIQTDSSNSCSFALVENTNKLPLKIMQDAVSDSIRHMRQEADLWVSHHRDPQELRLRL